MGDQDSGRRNRQGKRCGVWPTEQGGRKANPPGRALVATAGRSRLQALHQAGGRDVEFGLPGKDGQRQTRLGGLSRQLLRDQDSGHCTRRGGRDEEFGLPGREGERQTRLGGLSQRLMGDQDSGRRNRRGKRCGVWPTEQGGRKANPPGRALVATDGRSRLRALHQAGGKRRGVWPAGQGGRKANPPGRALAATDGRSRLRASQQAGEKMWSLAHRAGREKGKPAWEGSRGN
ncbi:hypothetical protein ROHU_030472 [Labeo rohita]|uniref:Uncharacterized protein n=1 Tax=Labeo rohita TaxID=84645 RepID=A0A498LUC3_LABRO|nr:hypothetical protein ROHU_030472 [Labeo rohita]